MIRRTLASGNTAVIDPITGEVTTILPTSERNRDAAAAFANEMAVPCSTGMVEMLDAREER